MGMFDHVYPIGEKKFTCREGHEIIEFQTKDLENALLKYYLFDGRLYEEVHKAKAELDPKSVDDRILRIAKQTSIDAIDKSPRYKTVSIYTDCKECLPILTKSVWGSAEQHPNVEYELGFGKDGQVEKIENKSETREELQSKLTEQGLRIVEK